MKTSRSWTRWAAAGVILVVGAAGCSPDPAGDGPVPPEQELPLGATQPDPVGVELQVAVEGLRASAEAAGAALDEAVGATDLADAVSAAERAVGLLTAADRLGGTTPTEADPLLPGRVVSREEQVEDDDALSAALSAARFGGAAGAALLRRLSDPIAGDLGVWQRDPGGLYEQIDTLVRGRPDLPTADEGIAELEGDAVRALAWAALSARAGDLDSARAFAERAAAHVGVVLTALEDLDLGL